MFSMVVERVFSINNDYRLGVITRFYVTSVVQQVFVNINQLFDVAGFTVLSTATLVPSSTNLCLYFFAAVIWT
jgi:hypothetical protein